MSQNQTTPKVLIVDDLPQNLFALQTLLEQLPVEIIQATSGEEALNLVLSHDFALAMVDVQMPHMNGYELVELLRGNYRTKNMPVIFVSAIYSELEHHLQGYNVGAVDFLSKPFVPSILLSKVKVFLQLYEQRNELESTIAHLQTMQKQLIESEKMAALGQLVTGITHEINTPAGVGLTMASYLADETTKTLNTIKSGKIKVTEFKHYLETALESSTLILNNLQRVSDLVNVFNKVAVDQHKYERESFGVKDYIQDILLSLSSELDKVDHHIDIEGKEIYLNSYPGDFFQIIKNLVTNSLQHGVKKEQPLNLWFKLKQDEKYFHLEYGDNGRGIKAEDKPKIFDPFFTTARGSGGIGLGLHIVYNIITQKLHGQINFESELGTGTTFFITLPQE